MNKTTALITGITGQDGCLLAHDLLSKGYVIYAPVRKNFDSTNLKTLNIFDSERIHFLQYEEHSECQNFIAKFKPAEIYHFAAISHVGESHKNPEAVLQINTNWTLDLLSSVAKMSPESRFLFASSCEIFDKTQQSLVNENSKKSPLNPYAIAKLAAHNLVEYYRNVKNIHASNVILFNHESILRPDTFVTQKVFKNVARIVKQGGKPLELGNILAEKDWSYAPDLIPAFHEILQTSQADDYVLASGEMHSVKELVECSFASLNYSITWKGEGESTQAFNQQGDCVVKINPKFYRPLDKSGIKGDSSKAREILGWQGSRPFADWVAKLTLNQFRKL